MLAGAAPVWENINPSPEPITLHQDCTVFVSESDPEKSFEIALAKGRQAYLLCIEGVLPPHKLPLAVSLHNSSVGVCIAMQDVNRLPPVVLHGFFCVLSVCMTVSRICCVQQLPHVQESL